MSGSPQVESQEIQHSDMRYSGRIAAIDALRGMAALYVFLYHLVLVPKPNLLLPHWIYSWVKYGFSGVTLFIILSGFTLCHTMRHSQREPQRTLVFYVRRLFRIVPLYYVWLMIVMVFSWGWFGFLDHTFELFLYLTFSYNFVPD